MPSPTAQELQQLTKGRLQEARVLLAAGEYPSAWYLAGYSLELALKACICKTLDLKRYPENEVKKAFLTHQIDDLVLLSGLQVQLQVEQNASSAFAANWALAEAWSPSDRYILVRSKADAEGLLTALEDAKNGVIPWLSDRW